MPSLCDYGDVFSHVKGTIAVSVQEADAPEQQQIDKINKVIIENCAAFDNAKGSRGYDAGVQSNRVQ